MILKKDIVFMERQNICLGIGDFPKAGTLFSLYFDLNMLPVTLNVCLGTDVSCWSCELPVAYKWELECQQLIDCNPVEITTTKILCCMG